MDFKDVLIKQKFDLEKIMVMKHRPTEPKLRKVLPWLAVDMPDVFIAYQQSQNPDAEKALMKAASRSSIGKENSIPEEMNHREIAVRMAVMNEVQLLFPSEPRKPLKSRSLNVVFLVEKDMRVERRSWGRLSGVAAESPGVRGTFGAPFGNYALE